MENYSLCLKFYQHSISSTWIEVAGALSVIILSQTQHQIYDPLQNNFFHQRGEALLSNRQAMGQEQLAWCLHTSYVLFLSSAVLHFLAKGKNK